MLIPTYERAEALVMTLSGVTTHTVTNLQVVVSSQGRHKAEDSPVAQALRRVIEARGGCGIVPPASTIMPRCDDHLLPGRHCGGRRAEPLTASR
jgi:hypothetical protein